MHMCDQRGVLILHFVTFGGARDGEVGKGKERGGCSGVVERQRPRVGQRVRPSGVDIVGTAPPLELLPAFPPTRTHSRTCVGTERYGVRLCSTYKILNK